MKRYSFLLLAAATLAFTGCEKVIDIDLNSSDPQYVIEASITDQPGPYTVKITRSVNFDESNVFPDVSGAVVVLSDDAGNTETLAEQQPGIYQTATSIGVAGRTYTLAVTANGNTWTAVCKMPQPVVFDSVRIETYSLFGNSATYAIPVYTDPAGKGNSYRFVQYINNRLDNSLYFNNDQFSDGVANARPLAAGGPPDPDNELVAGDTITIDMQCIATAVYDYYVVLDELSSGGGLGSATPANPPSNFTNKALGYFSAHTVQTKSAIVPQ